MRPLTRAGAIQLAACLIASLLAILLPWEITLLHASLIQGVIAAWISFYTDRMAYWRALIHLFFTPALLATLALELPTYSYLAGFILLALIFGRTDRTQVPFFLSSNATIQALAEMLPADRHFRFIDLGSGCGGLVCKLARQRPNGNYHGIELAMLPCWISKLRAYLCKHICRFHWTDIWRHDLASYDIVYAYLSPVPMPSLWQKACLEMRPGSLLISNTFIIPCVEPSQCIPLSDFGRSVLYVWQIP